ncbi:MULTISPECIES: SMI1/KNR4 family protein [Pseudomonas]|uniref:SMI1/KNR4 family protein n=1 Tax=Pseudomonas quercus TaxID=2722792 RepID=A0ABX0YHL6_9PSED|nr:MULTISPECIES: SMI1/KNR4 family protein [Pseudomonas]MBF7144346.1 SMI1/KNR4 family protein [Pseudomonas sp. LY10J]NJP02885.1 SMI1/KNR4 family protein [Pseudomonas quercus]
MLINLKNSQPGLVIVDVNNLEEILKVKFPNDLVSFYLAQNGGDLEENEPNSLLLSGFVPIKYGEIPVELAYEELISDFPHLSGKIPFAFDEGGNYFLLETVGPDKGKIELWIMDTEELLSVAESFLEFLEELEH